VEKRGVDYRSFAEVTAQQGSAQARGRGDLQRGQQALSDEDRCFEERNASFRQCEHDRRLYFNQDGEFHKSDYQSGSSRPGRGFLLGGMVRNFCALRKDVLMVDLSSSNWETMISGTCWLVNRRGGLLEFLLVGRVSRGRKQC